MKVSTWNVNGIRAREAQFEKWVHSGKPDVICLQEIKASPLQVPASLLDMEEYWSCWYGLGGYSGVSLHLKKTAFPESPDFFHPDFDFENRVVAARTRLFTVISVYVPNGGKDFPAKMRFLEQMENSVATMAASAPLIVCGDINIARAEIDVHVKERKPKAIGQLPEERFRLEEIFKKGLVDIAREHHPEDDQMFTWWPPWRNMRQRNIGWRIDYVLASRSLADRCTGCSVESAVGTSDHAPVTAVFDLA